jgi:prepilin peptidase CpaA
MHEPFFPEPIFGWAFLIALLAILVAASYLDVRYMVVPKWLTVPALVIGILVNVARAGALGAQGKEAWMLGANGPWIGAADGLLFALAGFGLGFVLFLVLWILGACGGGDVKLFAALGAWVGPSRVISILVLVLVVLVMLVILRYVLAVLPGSKRLQKLLVQRVPDDTVRRTSSSKYRKPRKRLLGFSVPLTIATALALAWAFKYDLGLVQAPAQPDFRVENHAR